MNTARKKPNYSPPKTDLEHGLSGSPYFISAQEKESSAARFVNTIAQDASAEKSAADVRNAEVFIRARLANVVAKSFSCYYLIWRPSAAIDAWLAIEATAVAAEIEPHLNWYYEFRAIEHSAAAEQEGTLQRGQTFVFAQPPTLAIRDAATFESVTKGCSSKLLGDSLNLGEYS